VQGTHGATARRLSVHQGQQQGTRRCRIVTGQAGQLGVETLEAQIDAEASLVLQEQISNRLQVLGKLGGSQGYGGGSKVVHGGGIDGQRPGGGVTVTIRQPAARLQKVFPSFTSQATNAPHTINIANAIMRVPAESRAGRTGVASCLSPTTMGRTRLCFFTTL
jgi:hypothetical protein